VLRPLTRIASSSDKAALYELAYDEAGRALSEQQKVIDSFRTRAGLLLSAAAITTSFLGAQALSDGSSAFAWLAMAGFVGVAVTSLAILWPTDWELTANPQSVIQTHSESEMTPTVDELRRDISLYMHDSFISNKKGLERLAILFQIASILLTVEVALWIAAIAMTR
jgi:hypothetical protein